MTQPHNNPQHSRMMVATTHPVSRSRESLSDSCLSHTPANAKAEAHDPTSAGLAIHDTNNTYTAAPSASAYAPSAEPNNWSLPEENFATNGVNGLGSFDNTYSADVGFPGWQLQNQSLPEQQSHRYEYPETLPQRSRGPSTPSIRVTTDFSHFPGFQPQPQDIYHSATSISSNSSVPLDTHNYTPHSASYLSPQNARGFMAAPSDPRDMQTTTPPRSPNSPHGPAIGEQISRKRSHSVMSGAAAPTHQHPHSAGGSRSGSVASIAPEQSGEEHSPRSRTKPRPDPPTNMENKFICNHSPECAGQTFDRKCEWR